MLVHSVRSLLLLTPLIPLASFIHIYKIHNVVLFLSDIDVWVPEPDHSEVPAAWWDFDADKSLLIGVFKHGK
jgi:hypothetical protein